MMSLRGQASQAKMTSPGGKLINTSEAPNQKVNKAEYPTYPSRNLALNLSITPYKPCPLLICELSS